MFDIIIIGQGYVGTLTALILTKRFPRLKIAIADQLSKKSAFSDHRATALSRSSLPLLKELSLWNDLAEHATPMNEVHIGMNTRKTPLIFKDQLPLGYNIENRLLHATLNERLNRCKNVTTYHEATVTRVDTYNSYIKVGFNNHPHLQGRLLIGADGRNSIVRNLLSSTKSIDYQQTALTGNLHHETAHNNKAYEFFIPQGSLAFIPLKDPHHSTFVWSVKNHLIPMESVDKLLSQLAGSYLGNIQHTTPVERYPLYSHIATPRTGNRWALLGDAANAIHPVAGQGMNLAIRDILSFSHHLTEHIRLGLDIGSQIYLSHFASSRQVDRYLLLSITHASAAFLTTHHHPLRKVFEKGMRTFDHHSILSGLALKMASEGSSFESN